MNSHLLYLTSWQTWQRPTLPRLETKYHRRWGVSRPSSEWDRVQPPRYCHQVGEEVRNSGLPVSSAAFAGRHSHHRSTSLIHGSQPSGYGSHSHDEHCLMRAIKPIELLVPVSYTPCGASTPGLSTWSSSTALEGELVSRWVSRLDAFSGYPVRT